MVDFFRSAMSYLSGGESEIGGGGGNAFVGQIVDLGDGMKLKVKKVIAEGGYGFVFVAQDVGSGVDYALKRQIVPSENAKLLKQEINFLKQLSSHPNIINFIAAAGAPPSKENIGSSEFLILTELITGGQLVDVVNTQRLTPKQVLRVFYETCLAVAHMHSQAPPIIHRDLKVENLLLTPTGSIKLCDFGSATVQQLNPDHSWSATKRGLAEDEIQRNTTPMYRSPEMIDLYSNNPVNEKADIWALGCLLYKLCFREHPFEDSAKLRILNANYHIPSSDTLYNDFHPLIRSCLVVDPRNRPSIDSIIAQLYSIADKLGENFDKPPSEPLFVTAAPANTHYQIPEQTQSNVTQSDSGASGALQATSQQAQKLFGFMKGGAENLFKNIKETSNKVITSVQGPRQKALDISYITSRILVMSFPYEDSGPGHNNSLEEVAMYLEGTHPSQYLIFNLSGEQYDTDRFNGQVVDYEWPYKSVPPLESLVEVCRQLDSWLRADSQNVLVIHCKDGIHPTGILIAAYLLFLRCVTSPRAAMRLFLARRLPEGQGVDLNASEYRYLRYITELVCPNPFKPHPLSLMLLMLKLTTVPLYNESRTGCRPFVEVFVDGDRVYTSSTKEDMDNIREYTAKDNVVQIPLGVSVQGNVLLVVHHIKAVPLSKCAGMGMSAVKMFKFQFHTGFVSPKMTSLALERNELDGSGTRKQEKFPSPFKVVLDFEVESSSRDNDVAWQNLPHPQATPITCFSTVQEQEEIINLFGGHMEESLSRPHQQAPPTPAVQGYSQLDDNQSSEPPMGNLLGSSPLEGKSLGTFIEHAPPYREPEGEESSSSESSSSDSSTTQDSEREDNMVDPFLQYKEINQNSRDQNSTNNGFMDDFFSNPAAANVEEANLLEFSIEDTETKPVSQTSTTSFDPWGTSTATTSSTTFDPFSNWEWQRSDNTETKNTPTSSSIPVSKTSNTSFDPFAPSGGSDLFDLMSSTPLVPSTSNQTSSTTSSNVRYPNSSGYSGWASFASTSSTSKKNEFWSQPPQTKDPFGDIWGQANQKTTPQATQPAKKSTDPFSDLGTFQSTLGNDPRTQGTTAQNRPTTPTKPTMTSRPGYYMYGSGVGTSGGGGLGAPPRESRARSPSPSKFGPVPNRGKNQFDELLDPKLFVKKDEGPTSLNELKKKEEIGKISDPDRAKVAEWADGKEHNIRALISSLHTILWEGETRWTPVGMHQLVEPEQVGKFFRRACLSVHPDKAQGTSHENLARAIFDELNDAYELFERSGSKSLYQV